MKNIYHNTIKNAGQNNKLKFQILNHIFLCLLDIFKYIIVDFTKYKKQNKKFD